MPHWAVKVSSEWWEIREAPRQPRRRVSKGILPKRYRGKVIQVPVEHIDYVGGKIIGRIRSGTLLSIYLTGFNSRIKIKKLSEKQIKLCNNLMITF